jgi:hypothetical protein
MILLCVAAAAAFHFFVLKSKSYHSTPNKPGDQRCNPLLVGGGSVGPSESTVQQNDRTKRQGSLDTAHLCSRKVGAEVKVEARISS